MTRAYTGIVDPQIGQYFITGQQELVQQAWLSKFQQPQFQQSQPQFGLDSQVQTSFGQYQAYQGPGQQGFAGYGQPHIQPTYQQPPYTGFVQQPYQS